MVGVDAQFAAFHQACGERIPALDGARFDAVAGGNIRERLASAYAMHMEVTAADDEVLSLTDAFERGVAVECLKLGVGQAVPTCDAPGGVTGDDAIGDVGELCGGGRSIERGCAEDGNGQRKGEEGGAQKPQHASKLGQDGIDVKKRLRWACGSGSKACD